MSARKISEKKIMKEMAEIAFNAEEKTSDRLRALDMLSAGIEKEVIEKDAMSKLDHVLSLLDGN